MTRFLPDFKYTAHPKMVCFIVWKHSAPIEIENVTYSCAADECRPKISKYTCEKKYVV